MSGALEAIARRRHPAQLAMMNKRATKRPKPFRKPAHWSDAPPPAPCESRDSEELGPTRYGDWVKNGIAVDF
jgi:hypothetical protein